MVFTNNSFSIQVYHEIQYPKTRWLVLFRCQCYFKPQFSPVQLIVFDTPEEINQILEDLAKAGHEDLHIVSLIIG